MFTMDSNGVNTAENRHRLSPFPSLGSRKGVRGYVRALFEPLVQGRGQTRVEPCLGQCLFCVVVHIPFHWQCCQFFWVEQAPVRHGYCVEDRALGVGMVQRVPQGGFVSCFELGLSVGVSLAGEGSDDLADL